MKKFFIQLLIMLAVMPGFAQTMIIIEGTVTDSLLNVPIPNHPVAIISDSSSGFFYYKFVYTNINGYYIDTIVPNGGVYPPSMVVETRDCIQTLHQQIIQTNPAVVGYTADFSICSSNSPCQASFTSYQSQPLYVQFSDASTGGGNLRTWEFGDGSTSSLLNPGHHYAQPGFYTVTLTLGALGTTCYDIISQTIQVWDSTGGGCQANFTASPAPNSLLTYNFTDLSSGNIANWYWNFGDGSTSHLQNPSHTYPHPGNYMVCLTVHGVDSTCYDAYCDTLTVGAPEPCNAAFTYYADSSNTGNTIHFIDLSTGNNLYWHWNFGEGGTSIQQNPVHTYATSGYYGVTLTISSQNPPCTSTYFDSIYVGSTSGCQANFTYSTAPGTGNNTVFFTDLSAGNPTTWLWSFGDGTSGNDQNPIHTYASPGTYPVCLTITASNNCMSTFCANVVIEDSVNYNQIYGQVFAGNFPLSLGIAMIFSLDTNANYTPFVDVSTIDSNGVYYFTMVPEGSYYIMAVPISPAGYLPTYYGNTISWELATLVTLGTPNNPYNISLVQSDQMTPGPGSASGQINTGDVISSLTDKINMILMNSQGNPIGFTSVSETGAFSFPSMAYGTYYLKPEMPGVTSDQIMITLSEQDPHAEVVMTFNGNSILGAGEELTLVNHLTVYPVPFTNNLTVSVDLKRGTTAEVHIYNLAGQTVLNSTVTFRDAGNTIRLNTSSLPQGIYTLHIFSNDGINTRSKLVKSR